MILAGMPATHTLVVRLSDFANMVPEGVRLVSSHMPDGRYVGVSSQDNGERHDGGALRCSAEFVSDAVLPPQGSQQVIARPIQRCRESIVVL